LGSQTGHTVNLELTNITYMKTVAASLNPTLHEDSESFGEKLFWLLDQKQ
jgi:hypothetical protein